MDEKPPFDPVKACFYLIAAVLGVHCVAALTALGHCLYWSEHIVEGRYNCENVGASLNQLLTGALAAALAFAGGFTRKPPS